MTFNGILLAILIFFAFPIEGRPSAQQVVNRELLKVLQDFPPGLDTPAALLRWKGITGNNCAEAEKAFNCNLGPQAPYARSVPHLTHIHWSLSKKEFGHSVLQIVTYPSAFPLTELDEIENELPTYGGGKPTIHKSPFPRLTQDTLQFKGGVYLVNGNPSGLSVLTRQISAEPSAFEKPSAPSRQMRTEVFQCPLRTNLPNFLKVFERDLDSALIQIKSFSMLNQKIRDVAQFFDTAAKESRGSNASSSLFLIEDPDHLISVQLAAQCPVSIAFEQFVAAAEKEGFVFEDGGQQIKIRKVGAHKK